jgi:hypothetical protein
MNQRHEDLTGMPPDPAYRLFDLSVFSLIALLLDALVYPFSGVALLLGYLLVTLQNVRNSVSPCSTGNPEALNAEESSPTSSNAYPSRGALNACFSPPSKPENGYLPISSSLGTPLWPPYEELIGKPSGFPERSLSREAR